MPLSWHKVGNEYALGSHDLYRAADQHDPEAVLDGVAMAGLVGVLRQLGDLAEFASQVFHGLYDEVMSTSARGHGLMLRVQQLEAELPLLEKDSCNRDYLYAASNKGIEWHTNSRLDHGVVTRGDTPRFIMESIKQCRGPPKLFMLDKYDIGGEGACLKRYTDPSFFKTDSACSSIMQEGIQRERRPLRAMEIRPNLQNTEIFRPPSPANIDSKMGSDASDQTLGEVPTRRRKLKYRHRNGSVFQNFRPQMQSLYEKDSSEEKILTVDHSDVRISLTDSPESNTEERDIMVDTSIDMEKFKGERSMAHKNRSVSEEALSRSSDAPSARSSKGYNSEVEIYVDALTTMDSEVETDTEHRDRGHQTFARMDSGNACSDGHNAVASRSSSFEKKDSLDIASANEDTNERHEEAIVSTIKAKSVPGEHERTSSLEELFTQEKPASSDHERTNSLEDLLMEDIHASGEQATEWSFNGTVNNVVSNATQSISKNAKEAKEKSNIATISFKKIGSKKSKYVGGMELIASKVGILPRKLSKKHDPFSDSLRSMAKELLELKYDETQDTELYDFGADGDGCDVKFLETYNPTVDSNESGRQRIPSDSPHDEVRLRECHQDEVNHESEHDGPPTDSPQDSILNDGNGFEESSIHYLPGMGSPMVREEEVCAGAECDVRSTSHILNHTSEQAEEKIEEPAGSEMTENTHTEVSSDNASDMGEDLKEVSIGPGQVNAEDINERNEYDAYATDDESIEHIEEKVVSDGMISSPVSSKQSDEPYRVTPLILINADDAVACKDTDNYNPKMDNNTLLEPLTTDDLTNVVSETGIASEAAVPDSEQSILHPQSTFGQDTVLSSYGVGCQIEQLPLCNSSTVPVSDSTIKTEENYVFNLAQETPNSCSSCTADIGDPLALDSRDVPVPIMSSFDWMLNGTMQQSFNVLPSQPTCGNVQVNDSSEDTQDPPPLPPLPPMQWRTNKLQTGSSALSAKFGRPPRPKPPPKLQEHDDNYPLGLRSEATAIVQESSLHTGLSLQDEMVQAMVSNEHEVNHLVDKDSQVNQVQEGDNEYDLQHSNSVSPSEITCVPDVALVKHETELIVIPEETWSEFGDFNLMAEQDGRYQPSFGVSGCNGMLSGGLSIKKAIEKNQIFVDHKEKEFSTADRNKAADSEENIPNGALKQDDNPDPNLPARQAQQDDGNCCGSGDKSRGFSAADSTEVADSEETIPNGAPKKDDKPDSDLPAQHAQQDDGERCGSGDKSREFSCVLEEEQAKSPPQSVPKPPRYPLLPVTSHDRSMLRKAPTLVQPSSKPSDEKNNILEQIKNKSFNLKPAIAKQPNVMGGPRTNLQVVAIIERAHAIRQAVADDEDEDTWSE